MVSLILLIVIALTVWVLLRWLKKEKSKKQESGFGFNSDDKRMLSDALAKSAAERLTRDGVNIGRKEKSQIDGWAQDQVAGYTKPQPATIDPYYKQPKKKVLDNGEQAEVKCPYCKHLFDKMPRAKRKCPACKELISPRRPPGKKCKRLVTAERAEKWEISQNRKEMAAWSRQRWRDFRPEIKDDVIADSFDFIVAPDCCEQCQAIADAGPYRLDDLPKPVIDTHPFCRCCVTPHI